MQPHQYALSAGIALLFLLTALPYLFGIARRRALDQGKEIGLAERDAAHFTKVRDLCADLDEIAIQREAEKRKHLTTIANLKRNIVKLEERITSYTGLAVTRADYERLLGAAETLRLTQRTLNALKSQSQAARAGAQAEAIDELAMRIHAQLRTIPASATSAQHLVRQPISIQPQGSFRADIFAAGAVDGCHTASDRPSPEDQ